MKIKKPPRSKNEMPLKTTGTPENFVSFSMTQQRIRFNDASATPHIGELLISFLEMDFREYEKRRQNIVVDIEADFLEDNQAYVANWIRGELNELRGQHPYFRTLCENTLNTTHYSELLENTFHLVKIQTQFKEATEFCLWRGYVPELEFHNTQQRYYLYHLINNAPFEDLGINAKVFYEPMQRKPGFDLTRNDLNLSELLPYVEDRESILFAEQYFCSDIASLLYVAFNKMIAFDIQVKRCENCRRFFMLQGLRSARYCNRPADDKGNTCRIISTNRNYKEKVSSDPNHKIYRATLKRLNIRKNKDIISPEEYDALKEKIAGLRRDVKKGVLSSDDYKSQMRSI